MVLPKIVRGPASIKMGTAIWHTKGDVRVLHRRTTFNVESDMWGPISTRVASWRTDISFTPSGELEALDKYWPYGPLDTVTGGGTPVTVAVADKVGQSIFTDTDVAVEIHAKTQDAKSIYHRAGILRPSPLILSSTKTFWGEMTITAIGKRDTLPTDAGFWKTISSTADNSGFDDSLHHTVPYSAALGGRATPFDAMGARNGFEIDLGLITDEVMDENVGLADILVVGISPSVKFAPNNLTEAQLDDLLDFQGTDVMQVGQDVTKLDEDLVISGSPLDVTLHKAGIVEADQGYGVKVDRNGNIQFVSRKTFSAGAPVKMLTLTIN